MKKRESDFFGDAVGVLVLALLATITVSLAVIGWQRAHERPDRFALVAIDSPAESAALILDRMDGHLYEWRRLPDTGPESIRTLIVYQGKMRPGSTPGATIEWTDGKR